MQDEPILRDRLNGEQNSESYQDAAGGLIPHNELLTQPVSVSVRVLGILNGWG
jgi:hypothetical protein